ncbi:NAD(P)-dependent dehydrogenase, short-chain alcohol dehydrogenase family [Filimonas lacunae]|uniref:NAD(P)-dependent dehydrogenase, short-chain alcohol dehydrogenase family n=1 Tax=Filimonas lacunae TaxID=477680 RepID=A0A173MGT6_9BACT|nr:SDR family NAD(P)-dependent oxidoreductase [Filimonas lacunae]BAV06687.1 short-chain dehydrogenase/reductase SDR [Filimonas lacunae]SIT27911.1 NAD(P)-dependent dehydrogenase, short-chain alcohol dehydrogenase family [Filimonas lacunae]
MKENNYNGTLQHPLHSEFGATSTTNDIIKGIHLAGKNAIVTGGYNGIGLETVKALVAAGANVVVPARDMNKAGVNLKDIPEVELEMMDLMNPDSIHTFAQRYIATGKPLHLLINNAGIMWNPLTRDARGYESQFATNHLGHFQLTAALWEALVKACGARVVNVSSSGHYFSPVHFEDVNYNTRTYNKFEAYGQSKTANILFTVELDKRAQALGIRSFSLHPGLILETNLGRHLTFEDYVAIGAVDANGNPIPEAEAASKKIQKTIQQGAATTIWCATSAQLKNLGGVYCENADVAAYDPDFYTSGKWVNNMFGLKGVAPFAVDAEAAQKLWTLSEELTGVKFNIA